MCEKEQIACCRTFCCFVWPFFILLRCCCCCCVWFYCYYFSSLTFGRPYCSILGHWCTIFCTFELFLVNSLCSCCSWKYIEIILYMCFTVHGQPFWSGTRLIAIAVFARIVTSYLRKNFYKIYWSLAVNLHQQMSRSAVNKVAIVLSILINSQLKFTFFSRIQMQHH